MYIMEFIISIAALLFAISAFVLALIAFLRAGGVKKDLETWIVDVKLRMGKLIKDINAVNELEYNVDVDQQNRINNLSFSRQ